MPLRVGILGLGAIGHLVAAPLLKRPDIQLCFFNRSRRDQFLFRPYQSPPLATPINCQTEPTPIALDWLLICLKAYHYAAAAPWLSSLIQPDVRVAVLRNGLDLERPLLPYTNDEHILPTLIDGPTQYDEDTQQYVQLKPAHLLIPAHPLSNTLQSLFVDSTLSIEIQADFKTTSWEKLLESAAIGAITCLTGQACRIFQQPATRQLYIDLLEESLPIARADGAQIADDYLDRMLERLTAYPPEKGSSMLTDRLAGRPIEVMAKNGIISQKGKEFGLATPLNDSYSTILRRVNR